MNAFDALELSAKYAYCKNCKSSKVGGGEGTLKIEDVTLTRSCKCGWEIVVNEDGKVLSEKAGGRSRWDQKDVI